MQRMEENNEVRAVVDMIVPKKDQEGDGWMASEGTCKNRRSPWRMPKTTFWKSRIWAADPT